MHFFGRVIRPVDPERSCARESAMIRSLKLPCGFVCLALAGCATLGEYAPAAPREVAVQAEGALHARAAQIIGSLESEDESAFWLLDRNEVAWTARLALTDEAVSTLDIQYFIWQTDATGQLLLRRVLQAADRGVYVRLLFDDFALVGFDREVAGLNAHRNIEVRVFNPWRRRATLLKAFEFVFRVGTLNHRMHNKIYAADDSFAIIGGRNIGDRYFGLHDGFIQNDLDVMVAGAAATDVLETFEQYWSSALSWPGTAFSRGEDDDILLERVRARLDADVIARADTLSATGLDPMLWSGYLEALDDWFIAGSSTLHVDSPDVPDVSPEAVNEELIRVVSEAEHEVLVSTPYFIPDREFVNLLGELTDRGVRVAVVTNSLASNNQSIAHTGYRPWRRRLLRLGVELYEFRRDAELRRDYATPPVVAGSMGLHTKAVVVDRRLSLVGSPNVDPRSLVLNTEIALTIDSEELAGSVAELILRDMRPENAWQVRLTGRRSLTWSNADRTVSRQPARGFGQRVVEFFMFLLPVKGQL
jgi:cardiolipin synthase C